jgi:hypothetical protein
MNSSSLSMDTWENALDLKMDFGFATLSAANFPEL